MDCVEVAVAVAWTATATATEATRAREVRAKEDIIKGDADRNEILIGPGSRTLYRHIHAHR
jgi:hypothetical protein